MFDSMTPSFFAAAFFCGITFFLHLLSITIAAWRCRPQPSAEQPGELPAVSIVRPLCGLDNFLEETLRTINPDELTPRAALEALYRLKSLLSGSE